MMFRPASNRIQKNSNNSPDLGRIYHEPGAVVFINLLWVEHNDYYSCSTDEENEAVI